MKQTKDSIYPILEFITKNYPCEVYPRVLEIAAGTGKFSEILSNIGYQVTAIDPEIEIKKEANYKIAKTNFNLYTDISEYDLGIAVHPCGIHESIIKNFKMNDKALFLIPCCTFSCKSNNEHLWKHISNNEWIKYLQSINPELKKKRLYKKPYHDYGTALYTK